MQDALPGDRMPSTLNRGFRAIGTAVHLLVPASLLVLVGDLRGLAWRGLLARRKFRGLAGRVAGGERLGIRTIRLVRPPTVVLDNSINDPALFGPLTPRISSGPFKDSSKRQSAKAL